MITTEQIFNAINTSPQSACNALVALYRRQTADEQQAQTTAHDNRVGFNGCDAGILSSFAEQVLRNRAIRTAGGQAYATDLSEKQLAILRKKLVKYSRQLLQIAEEKAARRAARTSTDLPRVVEMDLTIPADLQMHWAQDAQPVGVSS